MLAACAIALPVTVESRGPADRPPAPASVLPERAAPRGDGLPERPARREDGKARTPSAGDPSPLGPHLSTALHCGPALSSPDGIKAQTCVAAQGEDVWARTYYRNATGEARAAALSLMGPGGRTVRTHCAVDAGDEPALCETPRERGRGGLARYTAVAEFSHRAGEGRLLLRSGSN